MAFPEKVDYVIVGAGIHGLSTAWHLAAKLKAKGKGDGSKIVVIDKDILVVEDGKLADLAPTILKLMQLQKPVEMTGKSLF